MVKTDLNDAAVPEDVAPILRAGAQHFRESVSELQAAWGDRFAGAPWGKIAKILDRAADQIEKGLK